MEHRLQKLLASAGIASRRSSEELIARGEVTVNGAVITEMGAKADPERDEIRVRGKPLPRNVDRHYLLLNKPVGYVTTVKDPHAERTVMQLIRGIDGRVYPVGRLDADTAGLLILTNDGEFTKLLTHPSHQVPKTYRAVVRGKVLPRTLEQISRGIVLEDGLTSPAEAQFVDYDKANNASIVDITLREGRSRQVRRMFLAVHHPVLALTRIRIGTIVLRGLPPGKWRKLHPAEIEAIARLAESNRQTAAPPLPPAATAPSPSRRGRQQDQQKPASKRGNSKPSIPHDTNEAREAALELTRKLRDGKGTDLRENRRSGRRPGTRSKRAT